MNFFYKVKLTKEIIHSLTWDEYLPGHIMDNTNMFGTFQGRKNNSRSNKFSCYRAALLFVSTFS